MTETGTPGGGRRIHRIRLSGEERAELRALVDSGAAAYRRRHARILLLADEGRDDGGEACGHRPLAAAGGPEPLDDATAGGPPGRAWDRRFHLGRDREEDAKRKASEELTVRAKANEGDAVGRDSVDQQQVGPEVALPTVYPVPPQGMVLQEFGQPLSLHEEINNVPEKASDLRIPSFLPPEILSEASGPVERYQFAPPFESVAKSGTSPSIMSLAPMSWAVSISALKFAAVSPGVPFRWCQRSSTTGYPDLGRTRNTA